MTINFKGRVAIVTGAGGGLGREHALASAARSAKVVVSDEAPTRTVLCAGAGSVEAAHITMTQGDWIGLGADAPERLAAQLDTVRDRSGETVPPNGSAQGALEVARAIAKLG